MARGRDSKGRFLKRGSRSRSSGSKSRSRGHHSGGSRRGSFGRSRRGTGVKTYGLMEAGGTAYAVEEALWGTGSTAGPVKALVQTRSWAAANPGGRLMQSIPLVGKDPAFADNRAKVATGAVIAVAGRVARKVPLIRDLRRLKVKVDRKAKVAPF